MASQEIIFAGFGGQGILSMGKFLAYAGMDVNMNVSWLPSYGPEMRGGTANCSVIVSDEAVGSPIVTNPTSLVVMNRPCLDDFSERPVEREDIEVIKIPAQTEADSLGSKQIANMVLLGALVAKTQIVSMETLLQSLRDHGKEKFFEINRKALEIGASYVVK